MWAEAEAEAEAQFELEVEVVALMVLDFQVVGFGRAGLSNKPDLRLTFRTWPSARSASLGCPAPHWQFLSEGRACHSAEI